MSNFRWQQSKDLFYWSSSAVTTSTKWQAAPNILIGASLVYTYVYIFTHFIRIRLIRQQIFVIWSVCVSALQHRHREPCVRRERRHTACVLWSWCLQWQAVDSGCMEPKSSQKSSWKLTTKIITELMIIYVANSELYLWLLRINAIFLFSAQSSFWSLV